MITRTLITAVLLCSTALITNAQSNVRPAPRLVRVPEMGVKLLAPSNPWATRWVESKTDPFASEYSALVALPPLTERHSFTHLELDSSAHPAAALEGGSGDVSILRAGWVATLGERIDDESIFAVTIEAEASFYDFGKAGQLKAGSPDPINDVYETRIGLLVMQDPHKSASWFTSAEVALSGEDDADLGDALTLGLTGGVRHQVSEDLSVSIGLIGRSRLEDSAWLFPYIGFEWRIADRLKLTSNGSRVGATIEVSDNVEFGLGAEYAIRQFRLNKNSSLPGGVIADEEISASAILGWSPSDRVKFDLEFGMTLWREFSSFADGGRKQAEVETAVKEFAGVRLSVTL
ncbi:MAG: hypothetical protein ACI8TQ_000319 [Planctomycetota bacterium]|jgi:hypothetical protein